MFEVDVKNVTEEGRGGEEGDQLGFGVLIPKSGLCPNLPDHPPHSGPILGVRWK